MPHQFQLLIEKCAGQAFAGSVYERAIASRGTLNRNMPFLPIARMIEQDDPEEVVSNALAVCHFYKNHLRVLD